MMKVMDHYAAATLPLPGQFKKILASNWPSQILGCPDNRAPQKIRFDQIVNLSKMKIITQSSEYIKLHRK